MTAGPFRLGPDDPALEQVLALIRRCFADMDGRIDPPSSVHRLTLETLADQCNRGEVWAIGAPIVAAVVLTPKDHLLNLGKLAVAPACRGQGLARRLVELADARARARGLRALVLQVRVELVENHQTFARLGFVQVAATAHPGFDRPTSLTLQRALAAVP